MLSIMATIPTDGKAREPEGGLLDRALAVLRARSDELRARGFLHVAVFGSVARRDDGPESDIDLVVEVGPGVDSMDAMRVERLLAADLGHEVQIISRCGLDEVRHAEIFRDMIPAF
jgi:predicted nucleotidyltransferase